MLIYLYSAVRERIAKIFSHKPINIRSISDELYCASAACADTIIRDNKDFSEEQRVEITIIFLHGLLHLTDRQAFSIIPAKRNEIMDELVLLSFGQLINSISGPNITDAEKEKLLLGVVIDRYNEANTFYGACKKLVPEGEESVKGTFAWEFGKKFSSATNHGTDIAFIMLGEMLLLDVLKRWEIPKKLSAL